MHPYTELLWQRQRHNDYRREVEQHRLAHLARGHHGMSPRAYGRLFIRFVGIFLVM